MRKEESFYTDDGAGPFKTAGEARRVEARELLEAWAEHKGLCRGGEWSAGMVLDAMQEDAALLVTILSENTTLADLRLRLRDVEAIHELAAKI